MGERHDHTRRGRRRRGDRRPQVTGNPWQRRIDGSPRAEDLRFALIYGIGVLVIVLASLSFFQGIDRWFRSPKPQRLQSLAPTWPIRERA